MELCAGQRNIPMNQRTTIRMEVVRAKCVLVQCQPTHNKKTTNYNNIQHVHILHQILIRIFPYVSPLALEFRA